MTPAYVASLQRHARDQADLIRRLTVKVEAQEERIKELEVEAEWLAVVSSDEARDEALAWLRSRCEFMTAAHGVSS